MKELDRIVSLSVARGTLHEGCTGLILAVSGGPDSMAMLAWYALHRPEFPLTVAHVHHGLRPESDEEEALVRDRCREWKIPFRVHHANVTREREPGETVESAARRIRYAFFQQIAGETGASHLATAHTKDDQCETVLLHLLHGAGPKGLCGIREKRSQGGITIIRPLLHCAKTQVLDFCQEENIPYAEDASNNDVTFTRNRIRHEVLPSLEQINPNIRDTLCRAALALQRQQDAMELRAQSFLRDHPQTLPADALRGLPKGEQAEILRAFFQSLGKTLSWEQTETALALLEKEEGTVEFDRRYRLHLGQNRLSAYEKTDPPPDLEITEETTLLPDGRTLRLTETVATLQNRTSLIPKTLPLLLRTRRPGDRIKTCGGTKSLTKRMAERNIPFPKRDRLRILEGDGVVYWCEELGVNPKIAPKEGTRGYFVSLSEE